MDEGDGSYLLLDEGTPLYRMAKDFPDFNDAVRVKVPEDLKDAAAALVFFNQSDEGSSLLSKMLDAAFELGRRAKRA